MAKRRNPPNFEYACQTFKLQEHPEILEKYANIAEKYPDGVQFTADGYPDFSPYALKTVKIEMKGNYATDFIAANLAAGYGKTARSPAGYTWHHHQDRTTMQLVPSDLHSAVRHGGGVSVIKELGPLQQQSPQ